MADRELRHGIRVLLSGGLEQLDDDTRAKVVSLVVDHLCSDGIKSLGAGELGTLRSAVRTECGRRKKKVARRRRNPVRVRRDFDQVAAGNNELCGGLLKGARNDAVRLAAGAVGMAAAALLARSVARASKREESA